MNLLLCLGANELYYHVTITYLHFLRYHKQKLILSGDIQINPGTKIDSSQNFTLCHWNLNCIAAHNFSKINTFKTYLSIHKTGIVCWSETYLDSSFPVNDENLEIFILGNWEKSSLLALYKSFIQPYLEYGYII